MNLSGRAVERDRALGAALRGFNAARPGERRAEAADAAARLRALGYISGSAPAKLVATYIVEKGKPLRSPAWQFGNKQPGRRSAPAGSTRRCRICQGVLARHSRHGDRLPPSAFANRPAGAGALAVTAVSATAGVWDLGFGSHVRGQFDLPADTGRLAESIRLLEPLARDPQADAETLNALGISYIRAGRRDQAARTFERVLAIDPDSSVPLENLGVMALERGDLEAARRQFEHAVRADPRSSRAHSGLGVVLVRSGDRRAAIESWTRAVQLDPRNFDAVYNLATTLARDGQTDAARPYLELFLKTAPPAFYAKDLKEVEALLRRR